GHPPHVDECGVVDRLLEHGPTREPVLAGDGQLSLVEAHELPGGEATLRLELQITQTRPVGKRAWFGHGSPSSAPAGPRHRAGRSAVKRHMPNRWACSPARGPRGSRKTAAATILRAPRFLQTPFPRSFPRTFPRAFFSKPLR